MDNTPVIAGVFAFVMAVFVWWSGRRDKLDAAKALIDKEERDRKNAKSDRDEMNASLKATQVEGAARAAQVLAEELGSQGRRDAQVARDHQTELVTEQQRGTKAISDQLADAAVARAAADEKADATARELQRNTAATKIVANELAKNTGITQTAAQTAAEGQQALIDQFAGVHTRIDHVESDAVADRAEAAADRARVEAVARSHAAAHVSEAARLITEVDAPALALKKE